MFAFWKRAKAVASAKAVIIPMLSQLQFQTFGTVKPISDQLWADPYFVGFFHNIVRYWWRHEFKREPSAEEFGDLFFRAIGVATGSATSASMALNALKNSFEKLTLAGDLFNENYGATLARAVRLSGSLAKVVENKEMQLKMAAADVGRDFVKGADAGLIYINLVMGTGVYDNDARVADALRACAISGHPLEGTAAAYFYMSIKLEYKERYGNANNAPWQ